MATKECKSNWTLGEISGALVGFISILGIFGGCFKLYYDVQSLKDMSGNQQADIYQLERKIKELSILNHTIINQMDLPSDQKKKLLDEINNIQIDWYRHSNSGIDKTRAMLPDHGTQ